MKILVLLSFFIICDFVPFKHDSTVSAETCNYVPTDIQYLFYSLQNPEKPISIASNRPDLVKTTHFSKNKDTILLVHGSGSGDALINKTRAAIVKAKIDMNIIGINWQPFQQRNNKINIYNCSKFFGKIVGDFLKNMEKNNGLNFGRLNIVGHSIAGAFCADIGYNINSQARSIFGLESCSYKDTAKFVECIHTGVPNYGAFAHANYYPNGGAHQPGCPDPDTAWCGHWRVIDLYVESITSQRFVGKECPDYASYKSGKCNRNATGIMGGLNPNTRMQGKFYLDTNAASPFAKG